MMNLWFLETKYKHTLVTFAESEEEARRKAEDYLGATDSVAEVTKSSNDVAYAC